MIKNTIIVSLMLAAIISCGSADSGTASIRNNGNIDLPSKNIYIPEGTPQGMKTDLIIGVVDSGFTPSDKKFADRLTVEEVYDTKIYTEHGDLVSKLIIGKGIGVASNSSNIKIAGAAASIPCLNGGKGCLSTEVGMYNALYEKGARIYNQSFGNPNVDPVNVKKSSTILNNQVYKFYYDKAKTDSLFIWAAGNSGRVNPSIEASLPYFFREMEKGWIAVAAVDVNGQIAPYSNKCGIASNWCVSALGDVIVEGKASKGTSFAAPQVTGTAAVVKNKYPWMDGSAIRQTILSTAIGAEDGPDKTYGWGILDTAKALNGPARFDKRLTLSDKSFIANVIDGGEYTFLNDITGDTGLIKDGIGTLILTGNLTYTGTNEVKNGKLMINGTSVSGVQVTSTGIFASNGGVVNSDVVSSGKLETSGNGLQINGNLILEDGSVVTANYGSRISVEGKAILNDTVLNINPVDTNDKAMYINKDGITSIVLTAKDGLENTFHSAEVGAFLNVNLNYSVNEVEATVERKDIRGEINVVYDNDITRNNVIDNVEKLFTSLDVGNGSELGREQAAILQSSSREKLGDYLDSLSGQIYGSAQALTFQQSQVINKTLSNRLVGIAELEKGRDGFGIWMDGIGAKGYLKEKGYASADTKLFGTQVGIDKHMTNEVILGASAAYSEADAKFDRYGGKSEANSMNVSVYGRYGNEYIPYYVSGRIGVGFVKSKVDRYILPTNENASIEHDDRVFSSYLELGYKVQTDGVDITPFVGISYDNVKRGSFKEEGSTLALQADSKKYDQISGLVGVRAEKKLNWKGGKSTVQGYVTWQRAMKKEDLDFEASFIAEPEMKFDVKGIGLAKDTIWSGVGVVTKVDENWSWSANYDMQVEDSKVKNNVVTVGVRYDF